MGIKRVCIYIISHKSVIFTHKPQYYQSVLNLIYCLNYLSLTINHMLSICVKLYIYIHIFSHKSPFPINHLLSISLSIYIYKHIFGHKSPFPINHLLSISVKPHPVMLPQWGVSLHPGLSKENPTLVVVVLWITWCNLTLCLCVLTISILSDPIGKDYSAQNSVMSAEEVSS